MNVPLWAQERFSSAKRLFPLRTPPDTSVTLSTRFLHMKPPRAGQRRVITKRDGQAAFNAGYGSIRKNASREAAVGIEKVRRR
jgi:hypothetical protein